MTNSLRARAMMAVGVGFAMVVGLAIGTTALLRLSAWYAAKSAAVYAVAALVALGYLSGGHPFGRFGPANQVTLARVVLLALIAGLIGEGARGDIAVALVSCGLVMVALDGIDGWLARQTRLVSAFGARFDMEVDALFALVLAMLTWRHGKAGAWVLLSGLMRYLFVAASVPCPWLGQPLVPTARGRAICVVQVVALILALVPAIPPSTSALIAALGLAALSYSFLVDILRLRRLARDAS